jgi:hypothetical protein
VFAVKKLVLTLATAALAGCNALTDSNTFSFNYSVNALDAAPDTPRSPIVDATGIGAVRVSGDTSTPCGDQNIVMDGARSGNEVRVTIQRQTLAACSGGVKWYAYEALITLPVSKTYHLIMIDDTGPSPVTMVDQQVTVKG